MHEALGRIERRVEEIAELVDGWDHPRSHRSRLHKLESDVSGIALAKKVLEQHGATADVRWRQVREWSGLFFSLVAVVVAIAVALHTLGA